MNTNAPLGITENGIVHRQEDGRVTIYRPARNGGLGTEIEVDKALADTYRLENGDIVSGTTETLGVAEEDVLPPLWEEEEEEWDEPAAVRGERIPDWLITHIVPTERLTAVHRINGLSLEEAAQRPSPRRRTSYERVSLRHLLSLAADAHDTTGRFLDFAAPFGKGTAGIVYGQHATGMTRTLRAVVRGAAVHAPETEVFVLLLRARGEEITEWRRRFPGVEVIAAPSHQSGATAEQVLRLATLVREAACRQTELGHSVLLVVDSLTGLWEMLLEVEEADAQYEADHAYARHGIREWMQRAGDFSGEGLLGSGIGGSLTLVGAVWHKPLDAEAEEEHEMHPHLRLLEHILHDTQWRVPLSSELAEQRLFPAIDPLRCLSAQENALLPAPLYDKLLTARSHLAALSLLERSTRLLDAIEESHDLESLLDRLL